MRGQGRRAFLRYAALAVCVGLFSVFFPRIFENKALVIAIGASLFVLGIASIVTLIWRAGRR